MEVQDQWTAPPSAHGRIPRGAVDWGGGRIQTSARQHGPEGSLVRVSPMPVPRTGMMAWLTAAVSFVVLVNGMDVYLNLTALKGHPYDSLANRWSP
jgi:hypothetical protein